MQARKIIATALNVSESAIKAWELGLRNPRPKYISAIEMITEGKVTVCEIKSARKSKEELADPSLPKQLA